MSSARQAIQKLQKQLHQAELKALAYKHRLAVAHMREDLRAAAQDLRERMRSEVTAVREIVPRIKIEAAAPPKRAPRAKEPEPEEAPKRKRGRPKKSSTEQEALELLRKAARRER